MKVDFLCAHKDRKGICDVSDHPHCIYCCRAACGSSHPGSNDWNWTSLPGLKGDLLRAWVLADRAIRDIERLDNLRDALLKVGKVKRILAGLSGRKR